MPLPVTKGEFNRLGDRLIAGENPSDADLVDLAIVLAAYQEVLERVKAHLRGLGFAPGWRVKTTKTMTDKLRRTHGMELSRMQDLAGARIVVDDLAAQDDATEKISEFYAAQGCACKVVDRRKDPRFGYKAVHLIVGIDGMPVEIQIRTELQDTWAQIVERLADRWGRGIRYGEDPENPESIVRSGEVVTSRRDAVAGMMILSDAISKVEQNRAKVEAERRLLDNLADAIAKVTNEDQLSSGAQQRLARKMPAKMQPFREETAKMLARSPERLDPEGQALLQAGADITVAQLIRLIEIAHSIRARQVSDWAAKLRSGEQELRDMLQLIADATDEGA